MFAPGFRFPTYLRVTCWPVAAARQGWLAFLACTHFVLPLVQPTAGVPQPEFRSRSSALGRFGNDEGCSAFKMNKTVFQAFNMDLLTFGFPIVVRLIQGSKRSALFFCVPKGQLSDTWTIKECSSTQAVQSLVRLPELLQRPPLCFFSSALFLFFSFRRIQAAVCFKRAAAVSCRKVHHILFQCCCRFGNSRGRQTQPRGEKQVGSYQLVRKAELVKL